MKARSANGVSQALSRRGIVTGLRYTAFGYETRDGVRITEPGVQITRQRDGRYGGKEDLGEVRVYVITPDTGHEPGLESEYGDRVEAAVREAGLPCVRSNPGLVTIPDDL